MRTARFGVAQTSAIAEVLDIAPASVSGMVKRLAELGLVEHSLHRGVRLTDSGCQAALQVLRRHRIIEAYLLEKLGYEWDTVDAEADRLEHAASDELVEAMARASRFMAPSRCSSKVRTKGSRWSGSSWQTRLHV